MCVFARAQASGAFVLTSSTPGRPDRACVYPVGEWEEPLEGPSTIFGAGGAGGDGGSGCVRARASVCVRVRVQVCVRVCARRRCLAKLTH